MLSSIPTIFKFFFLTLDISLIGLRANTALSVNYFARCIISTDDKEIAEEEKKEIINDTDDFDWI